MKVIIIIGCMVCLLHITSAYDNFEGLFKVAVPCFGVAETPTCNKTLVENYQPENKNFGYNEPTTAVFLFTQKQPDVAEPLHLCGGELPSDSTFDPQCTTVIIIHGWLDGLCRTAWMREMKEQFMQRGCYNVILVDWTWGNTPDRKLASLNLKIVGEQVGFVVTNIMQKTGVDPEKFHLIGHSYGSITCGFVSRTVQKLMGNNTLLGRITGLDPSVAPYLEAPPEERLTYRDAQTVDIIHSNGGSCFASASGDIRQLGHADFYPNGGSNQSSCHLYALISMIKGDFLYGLLSLVDRRFCYHLHSIQYFKVSINSKECQFIGVESASYEDFLKESPHNPVYESRAIMGMEYTRPQNDETQRKYYLKTGLRCPYYDDSYLIDKKPQCAAQSN